VGQHLISNIQGDPSFVLGGANPPTSSAFGLSDLYSAQAISG